MVLKTTESSTAAKQKCFQYSFKLSEFDVRLTELGLETVPQFRLPIWLSGNVVTLQQARLMPWWVTISRQVNHLGTEPGTQIYSTSFVGAFEYPAKVGEVNRHIAWYTSLYPRSWAGVWLWTSWRRSAPTYGKWQHIRGMFVMMHYTNPHSLCFTLGPATAVMKWVWLWTKWNQLLKHVSCKQLFQLQATISVWLVLCIDLITVLYVVDCLW